jgi:acyl-homoserine lactone acylase PvdQ
MTKIDELGTEGYKGTAMNMVMADTEGNIGYMLLLP